MAQPGGEIDAVGVDRRTVAAEVIELGEALFDTLAEVAAGRSDLDASDEVPPLEDIQAAADQFFVALRLLLGLEDGPP